MQKVHSLVAGVVLGLGSATAAAVEGSCGHNEMRSWVDAEEICYHLYGPLTEQWSLQNETNLGSLADCLDAAKDSYVVQRFKCELRGETPYRADAIHREWARYRTAYKNMQRRLNVRD